MLNIGDVAPDFAVTLPSGARATLGGMLKSGPVVLYFYPADFTPVCTAEACMYRDFEGDLTERGVQVVGVSPQDEASHAKFRDQFRIAFPLVADPQRAVIRAYGASWPLGIGVRRVSYLIGISQLIEDRVVADLRVSEHVAFVERVLARVAKAPDAQTPTTRS